MLSKIIKLGLDLRGGTYLILEADESKVGNDVNISEAMRVNMDIIRSRIDAFGVNEPKIHKQGEKWLVVQLPGIDDTERAVALIGHTALLEFKLVEDSAELDKILAKARELNLTSLFDTNGNISDEIKPLIKEEQQLLPGKMEGVFLLKKNTLLSGSALKDVNTGFEQFGRPQVEFTLTSEGAKDFEKITGDNIEKRLAIILDEKVQSAPHIKNKISGGKGVITGQFTMEEATDLKNILKYGALPVPMNIIENRTVGPELGRDSIRKGILAAIIGGIATLLFMLVYYKLAGLIADMALVLNIIILLGLMAFANDYITLTLPGIAGITLTIGMAVDANILIFERIRDELRSGKTVRVAIDTGYKKAFKTILDANVTTLIAALFLFQFGSGPVKGFALTLSMGIIISMFTAIMVTHLVFDLALSGRHVTKLSI